MGGVSPLAVAAYTVIALLKFATAISLFTVPTNTPRGPLSCVAAPVSVRTGPVSPFAVRA
jgi:hypothetical protein